MFQNDKHVAIPLLQNLKEQNEKTAIAKLNKRIVPISFLIMLLIFIIRSNITFAASAICENFNLKYSEFGLGTSLFNISYTIFITPGGIFLNKFKLSRAFSFMLLISGLCGGILAFAQNKYQFYILRFLMGISQAGLTPVLFDYLSRIFPAKNKLFAYGFTTSAPQFARFVGAVLALGFLSIKNSIFGFYGWQWLLFIEGLVTSLFAFVTLFFLPNDVQELKILTNDERNWLLNQFIDTTVNKEDVDIKTSIINLVKNGNFWLLTFSSCHKSMAFVGFSSFVTLIISEMLKNGESSTQESIYDETCANESSDAIASILTAIPYIFTGFGAILIGKYGIYIKNKPLFLSVIYVISSVFFLIWIFIQNYLIIGLFILTMGNIAGNTVFSLHLSVLDCIVDKRYKVLGISLNSTVSLVGTILGPILIGLVVDLFGFNGSMYFMIGSLLIASILVYCIRIKDINH